jgi:hypothetical protein
VRADRNSAHEIEALNPEIGFLTPHSIEFSTGTRCASLTFGEVEGGIALYDR